MTWHVRASDFVSYLLSVGFEHAGQTSTHDLYRRGDDGVFARRARNLTQMEVDRICDENDLDPPQLDPFFGDRPFGISAARARVSPDAPPRTP